MMHDASMKLEQTPNFAHISLLLFPPFQEPAVYKTVLPYLGAKPGGPDEGVYHGDFRYRAWHNIVQFETTLLMLNDV